MQPQQLHGTLGAPIRYNRDTTQFVLGDTWATTWATTERGEDILYVVVDDTGGFEESWRATACGAHCGRNLGIVSFRATVAGPDASLSLAGTNVNDMPAFGAQSQSAAAGPPGETWKGNSLLALDGALYLSVSRHGYGQYFADFRQRTIDATIVRSDDEGKTWAPLPANAERLPHAMFRGSRFGAPFFIQYGRDGAAQPEMSKEDRADEFIYALSPDGFWDNGNTLQLGRVRQGALADVEQWEFLTGIAPDGTTVWEKGADPVDRATAVLSAPGRCSLGSAAYVAALSRYVLAEWYYPDLGPGCDPSTDRPARPSESPFFNPTASCVRHSRWQFYSARHPWGPWTIFFEQDFAAAPGDSEGGYYNPQILTRFAPFVAPNDGTITLWLLASGNFATAAMPWQQTAYTLHSFRFRIALAPPVAHTQ